MQTVAAVTIIRDNAFFLKAWLRHYSRQIGRENCYVISIGASQDQIDMAQGCSVVRLPEEEAAHLEEVRWRILSDFAMAMRRYYTHVIIGEVDELIVADPAGAPDLTSLLATMPGGQILTPLGLDLIHRAENETTVITDTILGPRRHVRPAPRHSRPCVISTSTQLMRHGQFAQNDTLNTPEPLYLLRLRFCDKAASPKVPDKVFKDFSTLDMKPEFEMAGIRRDMHTSWEPRGTTGFWQFARPDYGTQYLLPDRFSGMF
jgi:hypothetical protein